MLRLSVREDIFFYVHGNGIMTGTQDTDLARKFGFKSELHSFVEEFGLS